MRYKMKSYKWLLIAMLSCAFFFHQADRALFGLLAIPIQKDIGLTDVHIGWINTTLSWTLAAMTVVAGFVGDRCSRKWLITLSLGVSTPGYCIHETLFDDVPWRKDVIDEDVRFTDGLMYPSNRPGLGIDLNEEVAAAHPKADHWLRHYVGTLTNVRPPDSVKYYHQ